MDFGLSEEQRLIVETTRAFVENELYPHELEVERTGHLRRDLIDELKAKAIAAGLYAANMPADVGGAGLGYADLAALREGARPRQLRAALDLRGAALEHPARRHAGAAREVSFALHPRREIGLPRNDRAWRRLRPARHEGDRRRGRRRLGAQRHQAFHQPCRHRRFRDRLHGVGRGRQPARQAQEDHRLLRRQGHQGLHRPRRLPQRLAPRLHQLDPRIRRLPAAEEPGARRGAPGVRGRQFLARRDPAASGRDLSRPRRTRARPRDFDMRRSASSSASRSASSRASRSSSPTWRPN